MNMSHSSNGPRRSFPILPVLFTSVGIASLGLGGCAEANLQVSAQARPATVAAQPGESERVRKDVETLVQFGPRVTGTPVMEQAGAYLLQEFRKAGYVAEIQTFTYSKFQDAGSGLTIAGNPLEGKALRGTIAGSVQGRLVAVPKVGRSEDFAGLDVKGAIAIVLRGEIPFSQKAENAAAAGAVGLVIVNNQSGHLYGSLMETAPIPVLGLSQEQGLPLLARVRQEALRATLTVNAGQKTVNGRNIVAHRANVTQPRLLLGGHYDSVAGSPGANDNASGTAVVLETARRLAGTPLADQVWFVAFDGEEDGLHGSRAFVKTASPALLQGLKGMINFDMVGINEKLTITGTPSLMALLDLENVGLFTLGSNYGSDHASFVSAGVPVLFFHRGLDANYHKPSDRQVSPKLLQDTVETAMDVVDRLLKTPN